MPPAEGSAARRRSLISELPQSARDPTHHRSDPGARRSSFKVEDLNSQRRASLQGDAPKRSPRRKSVGDGGSPFQLNGGAVVAGADKAGGTSTWEVEQVAQEISLKCHDASAASVSSPPDGVLPPLKLRHRHSVVDVEVDSSPKRRASGVGIASGGRLHTDMATAFPECPGAACASSVYNRRKEKPLAAMFSPSGTTQSTDDRGDDQSDSDGLSDSDDDHEGGGDREGPPTDTQSAHELRLAVKPPSEPRKPRRPSTTGGLLQPPRTRRNSTGATNPKALLDGVRGELGSRRRNSDGVPEAGSGASASTSPQPLQPEAQQQAPPKSPRHGHSAKQDRIPVHLRQRPSYRDCQNLARGGELSAFGQGGGGAVSSDARPQDDPVRSEFPSGLNSTSGSGVSRSRMTSPMGASNSGGPSTSGSELHRVTSGFSTRGTMHFRDAKSPIDRQAATKDEMMVARRSDTNSAAWSAAFRKLRIDNEVPRDALPTALHIAGFLDPSQSWIDETLGQIAHGDGLEVEDFHQFLRLYAARECRARLEAFQSVFNGDTSGTLTLEDVLMLLNKLDIKVMFHVVSEIFREVDAGGSGRIGFDEFYDLLDVLATRQFFTQSEYEDFRKIYTRHDRDDSGAVNKEDLPGILGWLGYGLEDDWAAEATIEVVGSSLTEQEFIACMRKVHQCEVKMIRDTFMPDPETRDGTIPAHKLEEVLRVLGYVAPDRSAIQEVALDLDIKDERLDLSDVWQFMIIFRAREGLNSEETRELKEAFQRYDKACQGEISSLEVGKLLRWLGYQLPYEVLQHFVNRVDVDESGALDFSELRKLVRMHHERDLGLMEEAFQAQEPGESGAINLKQVKAALRSLGYLDDSPNSHSKAPSLEDHIGLIPPTEVKSGRMDLRSFLRVAVRASKASREAFRKNGGFTSSQVDQLKLLFKRYDVQGTGSLGNKEIVSLIEDVLPDMAHDSDMRPELVKLMKDADTDGNGSLEFPDFLRLMRQFHDVQDRERVTKEQNAIKETGFNQVEVAGFRELFISAVGDDGSNDVSFEGICNLISGVTPLGDKYLHQLSKIFDEVTHGHRVKARPLTGPKGLLKSGKEKAGEADAKKNSSEAKSKSADFPEFLWLMKRLMDSDFGGIKQRTQGSRAGAS